jgi:hypothetical protein
MAYAIEQREGGEAPQKQRKVHPPESGAARDQGLIAGRRFDFRDHGGRRHGCRLSASAGQRQVKIQTLGSTQLCSCFLSLRADRVDASPPPHGKIKEGGRAILRKKRAFAHPIISVVRTTPHPARPTRGGGCANAIGTAQEAAVKGRRSLRRERGLVPGIGHLGLSAPLPEARLDEFVHLPRDTADIE